MIYELGLNIKSMKFFLWLKFKCAHHQKKSIMLNDWMFEFFRHLFQLHHVHGGFERGHHHHDSQLSSSTGWYTRDAQLGKTSSLSSMTLLSSSTSFPTLWSSSSLSSSLLPGAFHFPPVDPLDPSHESAGRENHQKNHYDAGDQDDEGLIC